MEKLYYRYRAFTTLNIESLYNDTIYFANPGSFNDPLDCSFEIECDSSDVNEIRQLYLLLFSKRIEKEILLNLKNAKVSEKKAREFANKRTEFERSNKLEDIAYLATEPDNMGEASILRLRIKDEINMHYTKGVVCFSSSYKSPVLWSHYGDQHKGICIGYSIKKYSIQKMQSVIYDNSRSINMSTLIAAFLHDDKKAQSDLNRDILLRKAKEWNYEKESRLIGEQGIQYSPLLLTEITFGLYCSEVLKHTIMKALESRNLKISFYQIHTKSNSYSLKRVKLDNSEYDDFFLKTAQSVAETFDSVILENEI